MAALSRGIAAVEGRVVADLNKSSSRVSSSRRGIAMRRSRSFKTFRTIQKSPRLKRSGSRVFVTAMQSDQMSFFTKQKQDDDLMFKFDDEEEGVAGDESNTAMVDTVNAVLADIVDGQKYLKETGRTKARPMKRRGVVVSLALGAVDGRLGSLGSLRRTPSTTRLARTPSCSGFGCTVQLFSQMSFGSSSSHH